MAAAIDAVDHCGCDCFIQYVAGLCLLFVLVCVIERALACVPCLCFCLRPCFLSCSISGPRHSLLSLLCQWQYCRFAAAPACAADAAFTAIAGYVYMYWHWCLRLRRTCVCTVS